MKSIHGDSDLPKLSGFHSRKAREAGQALEMKSKIMYLLQTNASPRDPSTIMKVLTEAM